MKRIILAALIAGIVLGAKGLKAEETDALAPCLDLEKIIVTPSRMEQRYKDSPVNISIIEESDIKDSGATEITQVLDTLPSVNIIDYGSFGSTKSVHTRGASSSQVITLVNGRLANTPRDGMTDHNQIPIDNIERIEVLRGPASNIYGANAVGGVINIVTKSGKKEMETEFETKVGKHATSIGHFAHGWKVNDFDYFVTSGYMESKGHRQNSDYEKHDHTVKLGYDLNNENRLTLDMGYGASEAGSPGRNSDVDLDDREERRTDYLDVTWQGSCWSDSKVLLKLYQNMDRLEFIESLSPVHSKDTHQTKT
ncbi:MAG: TonB-dependent receptor plug domain-containing protein, partial [Candidatus Omnitrophota bacterium]